MDTEKSKRDSDDERKAKARYVDQPGQWIDCTPASVKKKQAKAWKALEKMFEKKDN